MSWRLDLALIVSILGLAGAATLAAATMREPGLILAPGAAGLTVLAASRMSLRQTALAVGAMLLALVAYAPGIGAVEQNLLFTLPLYDELGSWVTPLEVLLAIACGLAGIWRCREGPPLAVGALAGTFAGFLLLVAVAFLRGSGQGALTEFRLLLPLFLAFLMAWLLPLSGGGLRCLRIGVLAGVFAGGMRAVILHALHQGFQYGEFLRVSVDTGDFLFQVFVFVWLFAAWLEGGKRWAAAMIPVVLASILFSFARGAWIIALVATVSVSLLAWTRGRGRVRRIMWALPAGAAVILGLVFISGNSSLVADRLATVTDWKGHDPNVYRLVEAHNAVATIRDHPVWGGGLGARYEEILSLRRSAHIPLTALVHNGFLWLGLKGGVPLALFFGAVLLLGLRVSAGRALDAADPETRIWYLAAFGFLCAYIVFSMAGALVQHVRDNVLLGIVLGLAAQRLHTPPPKTTRESSHHENQT